MKSVALVIALLAVPALLSTPSFAAPGAKPPKSSPGPIRTQPKPWIVNG